MTAGQDRRAGTIADATCARGAVPLRATLFEDREARLLVLAVWEQRDEGLAIFGSIRTLRARPVDGMARSCVALAQNASSAPHQQRSALLASASVCNASKDDPAAIAQLRAVLSGSSITLPAACR